MFKLAYFALVVCFALTVHAVPFTIILSLDKEVQLPTKAAYYAGPMDVPFQVDTDKLLLAFEPRYKVNGKNQARNCHFELKQNGRQIVKDEQLRMDVNPDTEMIIKDTKEALTLGSVTDATNAIVMTCDLPSLSKTPFDISLNLRASGIKAKINTMTVDKVDTWVKVGELEASFPPIIFTYTTNIPQGNSKMPDQFNEYKCTITQTPTRLLSSDIAIILDIVEPRVNIDFTEKGSISVACEEVKAPFT